MLTLSVRNRSKSKRTVTPKIDELLDSIGFMRHVVPKDGCSLFRCISQCVFLTQSCHMTVRQHLLQFSTLQIKEFNQMTQLSVSKYAKKITDTKLDGELLDMRIAAKFYKINIFFYVDANPFIPLIVETPNAVKTLNICLNFEGTYDLVFLKESVANVSFCQAIVYEMLYNNVFKLSGVEFAVREMLFERNLPVSRLNDRISLEKRATCTDMKELLEIGITPFPFKVAKALTPKLYRNTEYDIWLNNKKEKFYGRWNNWEFKEGSKCLVTIGSQEYHCYIQRIREKSQPVEVYVKDLAQKIDVEFDQLKLIPVEHNVRDVIESPIQVGLVTSTSDDEHRYTCEIAGHQENPILYRNPGFIHRQAIHGVIPGPVFSPSCYVHHQYQQQPTLAMTPVNSTNGGSLMHPWYMSTPPPVLPSNFGAFKEQIVLLEQSNLNKNCVPPSNFPPPNFIDASSKVTEPHVQPITSTWYCVNDHQSSTLCRCVQCNNGEESGVAMDSNRAYQPWPVPEFDVPAEEVQQ